jgi:hypothetical protein
VKSGRGSVQRCIWERHMTKLLTEEEAMAIADAAAAVTASGVDSEVDQASTDGEKRKSKSQKKNDKKDSKKKLTKKEKKRRKNELTVPLTLDPTLEAELIPLLNAAMLDLVKLGNQLKGTSGNVEAAAAAEFFMDSSAAKFTQLRLESVQSYHVNGFDDASHVDGASAFFPVRWGRRRTCFKFEFPFAAVWAEPKQISDVGGKHSGSTPVSSCALVLQDRRGETMVSNSKRQQANTAMFDRVFLESQYEYGQVTLPLTSGTLLLLPHETGTSSIVRGLIGPNTDECNFVFVDVCAKGP